MQLESLYEAAILACRCYVRTAGLSRSPRTQLDVQVCAPATSHTVTLAQPGLWCDGIAVSPDETLSERRMKELLIGR